MVAATAKSGAKAKVKAKARSTHRRDDLDISIALSHVAAGGDSLLHVDERFRDERDFILQAVQHDGEAISYVRDKQLLANPDFAFEAVCRNAEALQYLPEVHRSDRRVVEAAAALEPGALRWAAPALRADPGVLEAAERGERQGWYSGEHLMLTGGFSNWVTASSWQRLFRVTSRSICDGSAAWPTAGSLQRPAPPRTAGAVRHRLVAQLDSGCLAFQLVSCARGSRFRIFPLESYRDDPLRLICGQANAVPAAVGGPGDGGGRQFQICEAHFAVVSIYVEVLRGAAASRGPEESGRGAAGTSRGAAVWFVFEPLRARWRGAVQLVDQDTSNQRQGHGSRPAARTRPPAVDVVADIDCCAESLDREHQGYVEQMCRLCQRTPQQHWEWIQAGSSGLYLAVAVECLHHRVVAFCRYDLMESANHVADERFDPKRSAFMPCAPPCLVIEHLEVLEEKRGLGLGRMLVKRLLVEAQRFRCGAVKLISVSSARGFYERLGFEAKYQLDNEQTWRELEPKEYGGHEVEQRLPEAAAEPEGEEEAREEESEDEAGAESGGSACADDEPHMRSWLLENRRLPVAMERQLVVELPWGRH